MRAKGLAVLHGAPVNSPQDCLVHMLNFALYVAFVTVDKSSTDDFFPQQAPLTNHYIKQKTQTKQSLIWVFVGAKRCVLTEPL